MLSQVGLERRFFASSQATSVGLTAEERAHVPELLSKGRAAGRTLTYARRSRPPARELWLY